MNVASYEQQAFREQRYAIAFYDIDPFINGNVRSEQTKRLIFMFAEGRGVTRRSLPPAIFCSGDRKEYRRWVDPRNARHCTV